MNKFIKQIIFFLVVFAITGTCRCKAEEMSEHSFDVGKDSFLLDGEPYVIKAAELHYPRIPREYWDHRIKMCRALGMNTICMYVFWNIHESYPGVYDFDGNNDVAEFIKLCQDNDMNVILRPGPYVCAEWEMGGLPWWLLKDKDIRLRENDPRFIERVDIFQQKLADHIGKQTVNDGGPILMIQVENEYGSYGKDKEYVGKIRDILRKYWGNEVAMFQCDWSSNFLDNSLEDLVWTLNFGTGADVDSEFAPLKSIRPDAPLMCSEFWSGWFDKWGANHETRSAAAMTAGIDEMLSKGISFSLYMTHGGTNWSHWAGANSPGYAPDVTSYDYDAPINEQGAPTDKYHLLRNVMSRYQDVKKEGERPTIPEIPAVGVIGDIEMTEYAPLKANIPAPVKHSVKPLTMEELNQGFGCINYTTELDSIEAGSTLTITEPHDFAIISLNGNRVGTLDRRLNQTTLELPESGPGILDIFIEGMGRINFGRSIKDFKGVTEEVTLNDAELTDWNISLLPDSLEFYTNLEYVQLDSPEYDSNDITAGVYRGIFNVTDPIDTYLDFSSWGKGVVYVNGHGIGRIWNIGPQQTLYMPGCWLKEGKNEILIFDILGPQSTVVRSRSVPVNDVLGNSGLAINGTKNTLNEYSELNKKEIKSGVLYSGKGWQRVSVPRTETDVVGFEFLSAHDAGDRVAIAEIYLLDEAGNRLSRDKWQVIDADSFEESGNHTPEKVFDLQESTYWQSADGVGYPHAIQISLGKPVIISGFEILPRIEKDTPESPRDYRFVSYE